MLPGNLTGACSFVQYVFCHDSLSVPEFIPVVMMFLIILSMVE